MTSQFDPTAAECNQSSSRTSGIIIGAAAMLMVIFVGLHPTVHSHEPAEFTAQVARIATFNAVVHGILIAVMAALVLGLLGLCDRLGMHLAVVRAGIIAYALGAIAMIAAATLNGFVVAELTDHYSRRDPATHDDLWPLLTLCHEIGAVSTRLGMFAMSAGVLLWSIVLAHRTGGLRAIGILGIFLAAAPPLLILAGHLHANLHGLVAFVVAQSIWYIAVAIQLIRNRI